MTEGNRRRIMAPPEFVSGNQGSDHGMKDAPRKGSISEELELMEKVVTAQAEYLDRLIGQLQPIMRTHSETKEENVLEADKPEATALGNQIRKYTANIRQNNARIQLILELLEL